MKRYKVLRITRIVFVGSLLTFLIWTPLSSMALYPITPLHIQNVEPVSLQATPTVDPTMPALEKEKLVQELNQLKNQNFWSWTNALTPFSTSLSILAALVVAIVGFLRLRADRQEEQRNREDTERHRREDQQIEQKKRDEERFQAVVAGFGDKEEGARVGAAIMLRTFLQSGYEQFYNQALDLAVAHL